MAAAAIWAVPMFHLQQVQLQALALCPSRKFVSIEILDHFHISLQTRPGMIFLLGDWTWAMKTFLLSLVTFIASFFRSRLSMQMEILVLRHQLSLYQRSGKRPPIKPADRILWSWISRIWSGWRDVLIIVKPKTVIAWQRKRFREHWAKLSRSGKAGRPRLGKEVRDLIRKMSQANPGWGSPRILGELNKVGIDVAKSTVEKYMVRTRRPPSPTWKAFLKNHVKDLVSIDFFVVPTVRFKVLFVLVMLAHHRRRVIHFNVTEHPTEAWTAQQIVEAFPWDEALIFFRFSRKWDFDTIIEKRGTYSNIEI